MTKSIETLAREIASEYYEETEVEFRTAIDAVIAGIKLGREQAAGLATNYCLVPPDGGEPDALEREIGASIAKAIRALP